jgi:hypothetical protein
VCLEHTRVRNVPDTVANPRAVVVKLGDASVAVFTVFRPQALAHIAGAAHVRRALVGLYEILCVCPRVCFILMRVCEVYVVANVFLCF